MVLLNTDITNFTDLFTIYRYCTNLISTCFLGNFTYIVMDEQTLIGVLTAFTLAQRQILLTLELLMNNNKRLPHTPPDTRHRIRELAYFRMIHESDLVCRQSTRMDRRTFVILCHLLRNVAGLSSTEIIDVEEMVAMFLHVLAHDVKNRVIQREFVRFGKTVSRHFNIVLFAVLRLYEELIKRPVPNCLGALDGTYIKVNIPAGDRPTFRTRKGEIATNVLGSVTRKGILFMSSPVGKDPQQTRGSYVMRFHEKMDYKCQRVYFLYNKTPSLPTYLFKGHKQTI
ncbi:hypothetical protein IC582_021029 [Cucumis melo]